MEQPVISSITIKHKNQPDGQQLIDNTEFLSSLQMLNKTQVQQYQCDSTTENDHSDMSITSID